MKTLEAVVRISEARPRLTGALQALGKFTTALASRFGGVDQAAKSWGQRLEQRRDRAECHCTSGFAEACVAAGGSERRRLEMAAVCCAFRSDPRAQEFRSLVSGILEAREADSIFRMTLGPQDRGHQRRLSFLF